MPRINSIHFDSIKAHRMTEKAFIDLVVSIAAGFQDLLSGPDSAQPISWDFVQGTDHTIACFMAQRYGNPCETGAANTHLHLDRFLEPEKRRPLVEKLISLAKQDRLG